MTFPAWWPQETHTPDAPEGEGIWASLQATLDMRAYRPRQAEGIVSREMRDGSDHRFILKNTRTHTYLRLSPEEFWVWEKLDGETSVQQLALAYFLQYKSFAFEAIVSLLERLREAHMLVEPPRHLYAQVENAIREGSLLYRLSWIARMVFTREFVVKDLDAHMERLHRGGGWLLFTWPMQVLYFLVSTVGLALFFLLIRDPQYNLLRFEAALQLGLTLYIPMVLHELAHAITAKHVGCEVYKGGVKLRFGVPAVFIDIADAMMFDKRARLAITWAGPYSGYILGGTAAIVVYFFPDLPAATAFWLLQLALTSIFHTTLNLQPVLKLDGYYLLSDGLNIPRLRERSMEFIQHRLLPRLRDREKWGREEVIFLSYSILALLSTLYFVHSGTKFWDWQASTSIADLLNLQADILTLVKDGLLVLLVASFAVFSITLLARTGRQVVRWMRRSGLLATRLRAAGILLAGALALSLLPQAFLPTLSGGIIPLAGAFAFAGAAWLAVSTWWGMRGSIHAWTWLVLAAGLLCGAAGFVRSIHAQFERVGLGFHAAGIYLACAFFFFAGRLTRGLRGGWREVSLAMVALGTAAWVASLMSLPALATLAAALVLGGLLHWRMRPPEVRTPLAEGATGSTRQKLMEAFNEMRGTILAALALDFGPQMRAWVEAGAYRRVERGMGSAQFQQTLTGMTPDDYGGAMALSLEELLASVERAAGRRHAWRALAYGYDRLDWERQEIVEDHLLQHVRLAQGLSVHLESTRTDLDALVRSVPLFTFMSEVEVSRLCRRLKPRRYGRGETIVRQGEPGEAFYLVRAGRVELTGDIDFDRGQDAGLDATTIDGDRALILSRKNRLIGKLGRGDYFGEEALLAGGEHAATVRALTPVELLLLGRSDFDRLVRKGLQAETGLGDLVHRLRVLRQTPLFSRFEARELKRLAQQLEPLSVAAGQALFHQGEPGDRLYIIESGKVSVQIDGRERATLGAGEYFGEIALLMGTPRTATVTAARPAELLSMPAEVFRDLIQSSHAMKQAVERTGSRRMLALERWSRQASAG